MPARVYFPPTISPTSAEKAVEDLVDEYMSDPVRSVRLGLAPQHRQALRDLLSSAFERGRQTAETDHSRGVVSGVEHAIQFCCPTCTAELRSMLEAWKHTAFAATQTGGKEP